MNQAGFSKYFHFVSYHFVKYKYTDARSGADRHYLAVLEEGHCRIVTQDRTLHVSAGEAFYIPMGLSYQSHWHGEQVRFRSYGFPYFPEAEHQNFSLQKLPASAAEMICKIPLQRNPDSAGLNILFSVLEQLSPEMALSPVCYSQQLVQQALAYMYDNPKCTNSQVASHCCISDGALYTLFRKKTGKTPNEMHQAMAVKKAVHLLTTTDIPIQHVSEQLDFSSSSYFRKVLKKHTGKTPMQIRKDAKAP